MNRSDIGRRTRAKQLRKHMSDKQSNPEKYHKPITDENRFWAMDYDYKKGVLPKFKEEEYFELKKEREKQKGDL